MKKILICGATGFIGRNLVEYFAHNGSFDVRAVFFQKPVYKIKNVKWLKADLRHPDDVARIVKGMDIIIQAAATTSGAKDTISRPYIHVTDNVVMNSYLLRSAYQSSVKRFVFFSCSIMYPHSDKPLQENEWDKNMSIASPYFAAASTKVYIEKMCEFYSKIGAIKSTVIRHTNIYGPYDKFDLEHSHLMGATISKAMIAENKITIWGSGKEKRDVLHVHDLVRFVELAILKQKTNFEIYNCGTGQCSPVNTLIQIVLNSAGKNDAQIVRDESKPTIKTAICLDCAKAKDELGWEPKISVREGVLQTVKWWKANINPDTLQSYQ